MAAIENTVKQAGQSIASQLQGYLAAGAIIADLQKIATEAENIHRESQRFGIDAEQLQVVTNAAKQLGLDMGTVARTMNLLEINAQKAIDPSTKFALAMEHLGINAKAFAALDPEQKILALADAYKNSAQDGQAYADVAELIGKRNTEMIPLLAQGSQAIIDRGKSMRIMSNEEIDTLHTLKIEEEKYLASLDGILAQAVVGWGRLFATIKKEASEFSDWASRNGSVFSASSWKAGPFGVPIFVGNSGGGQTAPAVPETMGPPASSLIGAPPGGGAAPVGITDLSAGGGAGGGGGGGGSGSTAEWLSGLNTAEKINTLLKERETIVAKLNGEDEQGDVHAASRYQLEQQLEKVDQTLLPLRQQLTLEEQKGVDAADRQIEKSQNRLALDQMEMQLQAAEVNGQTLLANSISNQIALTKIELDFDEKIQAAIDKANESRAKGLEQTAEENELLAQQLETEKQQALLQQQQTNDINTRSAQAANMQRSTDAFGVMAREGLSAGQFDWVKDPQQRLIYQARAQLEAVTGRSQFSTQERAMIAANEAAWAKQQQQGATQEADQARQQQIDYWQAIASGHTPPGSNPFNNIFGVPNLATGQFNPPTATTGATTATDKLQSQIDLQQQQLTALQGIQKNTEIVRI
jgi:hypothetical protein